MVESTDQQTNETQHTEKPGVGVDAPLPVVEIVHERLLGPQPERRPLAHSRGPARRPKHVPQRTCISCREKDPKRALTRIVRTPHGITEVDPTGKKNGRGAYLCGRATCWTRALSTPILARALKTDLTPESIEQLRTYAATLAAEEKTLLGPDRAGGSV